MVEVVRIEEIVPWGVWETSSSDMSFLPLS
jgi:hypothetical protein